jgi:hypothetical protein
MKYFAQLGNDNIVLNVVVVSDEDAPTEAEGQNFLQQSQKWPAEQWIEYSKNGEFRANVAQIGSTWDSTNNVFIDVKPYESWTLNTSTWKWEAPVAYPNQNPPEIDGSSPPVWWDEPNLEWYSVDLVWNPNTSSWDAN